MLDSLIRKIKKWYPQILLEECKYELRKTKTESLTNDDLKPSLFDNETDSDSDNDTDNESDNQTDNE